MSASEHIAIQEDPGYAVATPICRLITIGGSAGGIPALIAVLSALPADFRLPILVVQHLSAAMPSSLPEVLGWRSRLPVKWAEDREPALPGVVYVAPPDRHLVLTPDFRLALSAAAKVGRWRPAVDALFMSAAEVCGEGLAAIVLSGAMWDGAAGIAAVARCGGITIVQDEASSRFFDMPGAALDLGRADIVLSPDRIARALRLLAASPSCA